MSWTCKTCKKHKKNCDLLANDDCYKPTLVTRIEYSRLFHKYDKRSLFKRLFGYCNCPCHKRHWFIYPKTIRQNTQYQKEESNWVTCCEFYYNSEIAPYWEERWEDYYSSRL